ncbi:MAG: hypothetical protein U5K84_04480 [Alkalibacterium sp.]|nr:hypothetical protein [Alkalibacterium sp.]
MGNALMIFGGTPLLVDRMTDQKRSDDSLFRNFLGLFRSPSFTTYVVMFILALINIVLPDTVISVFQLFSSGNAFMAMFMVGLYLEMRIDTDYA